MRFIIDITNEYFLFRFYYCFQLEFVRTDEIKCYEYMFFFFHRYLTTARIIHEILLMKCTEETERRKEKKRKKPMVATHFLLSKKLIFIIAVERVKHICEQWIECVHWSAAIDNLLLNGGFRFMMFLWCVQSRSISCVGLSAAVFIFFPCKFFSHN